MRLLGAIIKVLFVTILVLFIACVAYLHYAPTFGAAPSGESLKRINASPYFNGKQFENLEKFQLSTRDPDNPTPLSAYLWPPEDKNPQVPLPTRKFDKNLLTEGRFVWLGHSTLLFKMHGQVIMTDPVFNRASPVPVFGAPFDLAEPTSISDLPSIDIVLISHDHYDHLDFEAIVDINRMTAHFMVPLGLAAHLQRWGVSSDKITELDWYESRALDGIDYTLTPTRHFSGRSFSNRFSTLWGSWVVKSNDVGVWFSGDSGFMEEFKKIGKQFGPFDIAFVENGAYSDDWKDVHMTPEQAVQASIDVQARAFFPIHWAKFDLALHSWDEPIKRAAVAAKKSGMPLINPMIGQVFTADDIALDPWWLSIPVTH